MASPQGGSDDFIPLVMSSRMWHAFTRLLDDAEIRGAMAARHALCVICGDVTAYREQAVDVALCPTHDAALEAIEVTRRDGSRLGWIVVRRATDERSEEAR